MKTKKSSLKSTYLTKDQYLKYIKNSENAKKQKEKKNMKIFNKKMNKRHEKTCHRRECTDGK